MKRTSTNARFGPNSRTFLRKIRASSRARLLIVKIQSVISPYSKVCTIPSSIPYVFFDCGDHDNFLFLLSRGLDRDGNNQ